MEQGWEQFLLSRNLPQLENAGEKNHIKKVFPKRKNLAVRILMILVSSLGLIVKRAG